MIKFRNTVGTAPRTYWWDNDKNQIAFCRGIRGFIAFNNEPTDMNEKIFTCLPSGTYCDAITGRKDPKENRCIGRSVIVDENGEALIKIPSKIGVLALHIGVGCFSSLVFL